MAEQQSRLAIVIDSTGAQRNAEGLSGALMKMTQAGQKAAYSAGQTTKATKEESQALSALLDRIDPVNAALNRLDDQQRQLAKFKAKGFIDTETFDDYSKKIEAARTRLTGFTDQLSKTGMSSKQLANNLRMIPAQMTDIVVSLQAGQNPFQVLLQQGGQLKDMFGGVGPAAKAFGGYLLGLVNPLTLTAAAAGSLGLAYYQGTEEQEAFNKSLIKTGNQAGLTAGQLGEMARSVAQATGSTVGSSASILNQLVSSGKVAKDSLQTATTAIVNMSKVSGESTDQLAADFDKIAVNPVEAISKLNEQYHFLSLATYEQIKALQDQGNSQEAARLASENYANTINQRSVDINNSLGSLEKGWNSLGRAAKSAWDSMLDIGRSATPEAQLATLEANLADAKSKQSEGGVWNRLIANSSGYNIDEMEKQVAELKSQIATQGILNSAISDYQARQDEAIKTQQEADRSGQQYMNNSERRAKAIQKESAFLKAGAITAEEYARRVSRINEMYKDPKEPKQPKAKAYTEDAGKRLLDQINQQTAALQAQYAATDKVSSATQQRVKFEQQIADLKSKSQLTSDQKSVLAMSDQILQAYKLQESLSSQVQTLDDYRKMQEEVAPKEVKQNETLQKRLEILQKMVALKKLTPEDAGRQASDLVSNSVLPDSVISGVNQAGGTLTSGATNKDLSGQGMAMIGLQIDPQLEVITRLKQAQTDYATWLNEQEQIISQNSVMNEQQRQQALLDLHKTGMTNQQNISTAVYAAEMQSAQNSFSSITDSMGTMFGEQSAAYKAAFVTQKAFALAQAAIQLPMAMGQALAGLPFPANLAAMATVAGLMATITSSITGAAATGFETGGYTGNMGTKSIAGVVHGQEYVFDAAATRRIGVSNLEAIRSGGLDATLSKSGFGTGNNYASSSGSSSQTNHINQVINMPQNSGITQQEMDAVLKRNNKQLVTDLSNQTLEGKGKFGRSLRAAQGRGNRMT